MGSTEFDLIRLLQIFLEFSITERNGPVIRSPLFTNQLPILRRASILFVSQMVTSLSSMTRAIRLRVFLNPLNVWPPALLGTFYQHIYKTHTCHPHTGADLTHLAFYLPISYVGILYLYYLDKVAPLNLSQCSCSSYLAMILEFAIRRRHDYPVTAHVAPRALIRSSDNKSLAGSV